MGFSKGKLGLIAAGFAIGTVGIKAVTSKPAKNLYVHALAKGMQAKASGEDLVEKAKIEFDDIYAEASYIQGQQASATQPATKAEAATVAVAKVEAKAGAETEAETV
jgi:hypothetical protein